MKHISLLAVVLVSLLTGCATRKPGQVLDPSVVDHLHVGQKRNDVLVLLGQPNQTHLGKATVRDSYWVFNDQKGRESSDNLWGRHLTILYDAKDTLLKSHYSEHEVPVGGDLRGLIVGRKLPMDIADKIQPGVTKSSDLTGWLGEPFYTKLDMIGNLLIVWGGAQENRFRHIENKMLAVSVDDFGFVITYRIYGFENYFNPPARRKTLRLSEGE